MMYSYVFFFKQRTAYEMRMSVWSSDVCSSDLLGDHALPGEETVLRTEAEAIDVAAEARKRNGELDGFRIDRLAPLRREDAKLGLGAIFEYGHLDSEVAALEQAAAVGPFALFFTLTMAFAFFMLVFALGAAAAGGKRDSTDKRRGCDANGKFGHRLVPANNTEESGVGKQGGRRW